MQLFTFTLESSEWKEFPDTGLQYNSIAQNQSSSWAVGPLYIFVCKQCWLVSRLKWNPWKLQLQLWKCMRSLESLWDFIHLPLTRRQVVCERPTSDAYVYAMHSHGNRFLILFQGLVFSFLLQSSWSFNRSKSFLWIFYSLKSEIQGMDFWEQFAFSPRGGTAGQLQTVNYSFSGRSEILLTWKGGSFPEVSPPQSHSGSQKGIEIAVPTQRESIRWICTILPYNLEIPAAWSPWKTYGSGTS